MQNRWVWRMRTPNRRKTWGGGFVYALIATATLHLSCGSPTDKAENDLRTKMESLTFDMTQDIEGLTDLAMVVRDKEGISHVVALNDHDAYFLQGWVHAKDRLFQMDLMRRRAEGTLAELMGAAALSNDVQLRAVGLRRAAERSLPLLPPEVQASLDAYTEGVNAYIESHPLPPEYQALELTSVRPWEPVDCATIGKAVLFSFAQGTDIDDTIALSTYQAVGAAAGFDGTALFFQDLFRANPFDNAATVPDAMTSVAAPQAPTGLAVDDGVSAVDPSLVELSEKQAEAIAGNPMLANDLPRGSNAWVVSGAHTASGYPIIANDPHLDLIAPSILHPMHLTTDMLNVSGTGIAGMPGLLFGQNSRITWGVTINPVDVTDYYQEQVAPDANSPSGLSTVYMGQLEPVIPIPTVFQYNQIDGQSDNLASAQPGTEVAGVSIPPAIMIVPRRNQGPIVQLDQTTGVAISMQSTAFSGTRELQGFYQLARAKNMEQMRQALRYIDTGSLNVVYADRKGNIAYTATGEIPLREDLQAGTVQGSPPYLIRSGLGGNEWVTAPSDRPDTHSIPYAIVPEEEMPQLTNPSAGFLVTANNDPMGHTQDNNPLNQLRPVGGLLYMTSRGANSYRAGRITQQLKAQIAAGKKIGMAMTKALQADTVLLDAQVFVPYILQAAARAAESGANPMLAGLAANPGVQAALSMLEQWDFSTPTGIPEGFDAADVNGVLSLPSDAEKANAAAATIYTVWRGRLLANTIDGVLDAISAQAPVEMPKPDGRSLPLIALRNLLDNFETTQGVGASGLNFFNVTGVASAEDRRDIILLKSVADSLQLLASDAFATAFNNSQNPADYYWGKLHRIVFAHPMGTVAPDFNVPPAFGGFPHPLGIALPGIPTDGASGTVDVGWHDVRAADENAFMYAWGAARRYVGHVKQNGIRGQSSLPGGTSAIPGDPNYLNLLPAWLTNETYPLRVYFWSMFDGAQTADLFLPTL